MKKKIVLLLTCIFVTAFLVTGCNGGKEEPPTSVPTAAVTPSAEPTQAPTEEPTATPTEEPTPTPTATPTPLPDVSLKEIYEKHGLKVGTCLNTTMIDNKNYNKTILNHFTSATMENDMKPDSILSQKQSQEAGKPVVYFNPSVTKMLKFAKENNIALRGHTICWYSQTPDWIFREGFENSGDLVGRDEMISRLEEITKQIFEKLDELGYLDLFYAYDVCNEALLDDHADTGNLEAMIRPSRWTETIGKDYLWYAFYFADKYAHESINLFYNDFNEQWKIQLLLNLIETLKDGDRYLIDGIGFQAHLYTKDDLDLYFKLVDRLSETGLILELTELDVCLGKYQSPLIANDDNLKVQGRFYYDLINGLFERIDKGTLKMDSITFWGFADGLSWRKEYNPLLYNRQNKPKYSLYGAAQMKEFAGFDE